MFRKLLKHEFIATRRIVPMIWLATAVIAALNIISGRIDIGWLGNTSMVFLIILAIGQVVVTYAVVVTRYYRSLYSNEGYLTHTLPVKASSLLGSKFLTSLTWLVSSYVIAAGVLVIIVSYFLQKQGVTMSEAFEQMKMATGFTDSQVVLGVVILVLFMFYSLTLQLAQLFFAMSFGNLHWFQSLGLAAPIISYIVLNFILEMLTLGAMVFIPLGIELELTASGLPVPALKLVGEGMLTLVKNPQEDRVLIGLGGIILTLFFIAGLFAGCHRLIKHHTSLR